MINMVIFFLVFLLGLSIGSFVNAVIYRLEAGDSVFHGRSYCPHCKHTLAWYDLIPLVSFVALGGTCRYCGGRISAQYPLVELGTALTFLAIFNAEFLISKQFSNFSILETLYLFVVSSLLIALFVYDLKHYILPDKMLFPAIGIVLGYRVFEFFNVEHLNLLWNLDFGIWISLPFAQAILSALLTSAFFFSIFFMSKGRAMGFGDVKLAVFMGLFLGWPNILVALFVAFLVGAVVGIILILLQKKEMRSEVPFGPFLITGVLIALLWGKGLVDWYIDLVLV